jgi:selenium metabolism protein YedF
MLKGGNFLNETVDARGLACPQPVVLTRQAMQATSGPIRVLVDNPTARDNVSRFAASQGWLVEAFEEEYGFRLELTPGSCEAAAAAGASGSHLFVLSADFMGKVDNQLGTLLMKTFLNTLAEREELPSHLLLFNTGVKLACGKAETVTSLQRLQEKGVSILVCGTCLDFLGQKKHLRVGTVSNMYEIVDTLASARSCITI